MLGQLGNGHVIQFWGHLRPPERAHIKDGFPLFGFFVDGQLGVLRNGSSHYHFRPSASTRLGWRALHSVHCCLGWAAVREHRGEGEGAMVELLPPVAEVRVGLGGSV